MCEGEGRAQGEVVLPSFSLPSCPPCPAHLLQQSAGQSHDPVVGQRQRTPCRANGRDVSGRRLRRAQLPPATAAAQFSLRKEIEKAQGEVGLCVSGRAGRGEVTEFGGCERTNEGKCGVWSCARVR